MTELKNQILSAVSELTELAKLKKGDILVVGCSTSEVSGGTIGKNSNAELGELIFNTLNDFLSPKGIYLACQCCEHLNRAIVIERETVKNDESIVFVIPKAKAGGSFATAAYKRFKNPAVVEEIRADAGIDIGLTLIGMHIKNVAVPVRLKTVKIGQAPITAAYSRPRYIGGERAVYK